MPANPSAAEDNVIPIKNGCLTRRNGLLRLVQLDASAAIIQRSQFRRRSRMAVTDLYDNIGFASCGILRDPIHAIDFKFLRDQILRVANDHAIRFRVEIDHITRARRTAGQTFALTDREKLDAFVFAQKIAVNIVNLAAMKLAFAQMRTQKCLVVVSWDETNLLAIDFVRDFQAQRTRNLPDRRLRHSA